MKPITEMTEHEILREIRFLNDCEGYFGAIASFVHENNVTQQVAWKAIEKRRDDLGLGVKFSTYASYRSSKTRFSQSGGMFRLNPDD